MLERKIKVLLSKLGLDVHNRGVITVSKQLRDEGMEVIYIGNALPEEIINIAIQEAVDIIGVSSLAGAHIQLGQDLIKIAGKKHLNDVGIIIGGIFSPQDVKRLLEIGFDDVFTAGAMKKDIIGSISRIYKKKVKNKEKKNKKF